mmetsp:Transcript_2439/g.4833  ORF Transcript_2439/g.4833 Transcript_2439/m.4833 type:complete len:260 (+) Transcript_2439:60-839(+)
MTILSIANDESSFVDYSKGNFPYFSFSPGLLSLKACIFFCNGTFTFIPPCPVLSVRASFSGSPAVHILPGPVGAFLLALSAARNSPVFFLNVSTGQIFSISIARKKWPRGMGLGLPVARSNPQMSSPQGPDWSAMQRSSTVVAHPYPLYPPILSPAPPIGVSAHLPNTISLKIPSVSVLSMPLSSITAPRGVSTPSRAYFSIFPRWLTDVAQSITKGYSSEVGMPKTRGFVPSMGSTPNVGAMEGRALVPVRPILKRVV